MNYLIAYFSRSGNTKKVSQVIFDALPKQKEIIQFGAELDGNIDPTHYDLIFLGFPIESYGPPTEIIPSLRTLTTNAKIVLFLTHGVPESHPLIPQWVDTCKTHFGPSFQIYNLFSVQSEVADYVVESLKNSPKPMVRDWGNHCHLLKGLPNQNQLDHVKKKVKEIIIKFEMEN